MEIEPEDTVEPYEVTEDECNVFDGWYADPEYTTEFDFSQPITEDTVIYGKWTVLYEVAFHNLAPEEYNQTSLYVLPGDAVEPPEVADGGDYVFDGWERYDPETSENVPFDPSEPINESCAVYAKWISPLDVLFSGVVPEPESDEDLYETKVKLGGTVVPPEVEEKDGWVFKGWFEDPEYTVPADFTKTTPGDYSFLAYYGKWELPDALQVWFNNTTPYGRIKTKSVQQNNTVKAPTVDDHEDWTFDGWFEDEEFTKPFDFSKPITEEDVEVYGKWTTTKLIHIDHVRLYIDFPKSKENLVAPPAKTEENAPYKVVSTFIDETEEDPWYYVEVEPDEGYYMDANTHCMMNEAARFHYEFIGLNGTSNRLVYRLLTWEPIETVKITADTPKVGQSVYEYENSLTLPEGIEFETYWVEGVGWSSTSDVKVEVWYEGDGFGYNFNPAVPDGAVFEAGKTYYRVVVIRGVPYFDENTKVYWNGEQVEKTLLHSGEHMVVTYKYTFSGSSSKSNQNNQSKQSGKAAPPTGDDSEIFQYIALLAVAGLLLAKEARCGRKKKEPTTGL